ncbi:hypothetical protein ACP70R_013419 [Stipagrostis hirtigluma subsp. patula]
MCLLFLPAFLTRTSRAGGGAVLRARAEPDEPVGAQARRGGPRREHHRRVAREPRPVGARGRRPPVQLHRALGDVNGIAALVRSAHPSWSPAMVRSAIMTTADVTDRRGKPIMDGDGGRSDVFAMGAGHVNPARAVDPGLVYDIQPADYVTHLCTLGYTHMEIFKITHAGVNCSAVLQQNRGFTLNYPSITVVVKNRATTAVLWRTVTNVGTPNSTYTAQVATPPGVKVTVAPTTLAFVEFGEQRSFQVTIVAPASPPVGQDSAEGYLVWKQIGGQGKHVVRSPIAVTWTVE